MQEYNNPQRIFKGLQSEAISDRRQEIGMPPPPKPNFSRYERFVYEPSKKR